MAGGLGCVSSFPAVAAVLSISSVTSVAPIAEYIVGANHLLNLVLHSCAICTGCSVLTIFSIITIGSPVRIPGVHIAAVL